MAPTVPGAHSGPAQRRAALSHTFQTRVVPLLLQRATRRRAAPGPTSEHIQRLASLSLQPGGREVVELCIELRDAGCGAERLYLDLLAPAAAVLGDLWTEDHCTFADVTIGIGHLQAAMNVLRPNFVDTTRRAAPRAPRAMLMPLPGEQHTFGLSMLSTFFVRAGWEAWSGAVADAAALAARVARGWTDLVGFSLLHDALLDDARRHIAAVRIASRNPAIIVMVGGPPFAGNPALAKAVGADATALDGGGAVAEASALLARRAARAPAPVARRRSKAD